MENRCVHGHRHSCQGLLSRLGFYLEVLTIHPALRSDFSQPVLGGRDSAKVFLNVLFGNVANGNFVSIGAFDGDTEDSFRQEDALSMMTQSSVAKVREVRLRLVEPVMDGKIVLRFSAELLRAALRVHQGMGHGYTS